MVLLRSRATSKAKMVICLTNTTTGMLYALNSSKNRLLITFARLPELAQKLKNWRSKSAPFSRAWCIFPGSIPGARTFADGHSLGLHRGIWRNYAATRQTASRKQSRLICFDADARHAEKVRFYFSIRKRSGKIASRNSCGTRWSLCTSSYKQIAHRSAGCGHITHIDK